MKKIVVLNSGGFDSVLLANYVYNIEENAEIYNLFFNYGQVTLDSERRCSFNCSSKLGFKYIEMGLPNFTWCDSHLVGGDNKDDYIPFRNLIFLSYALSFAESIGAESVYLAIIGKAEGEPYKDCSKDFIEKVNSISESFGIGVKTPFIDYYKEGYLMNLARLYALTEDDFHSCNVSNEPCGKCGDCEITKSIMEYVESYLPDDILIDNNFEVTEEFVESMRDGQVTSAKLYINNKCQFRCKHCFIGDKKLIGRELTTEEWLNVIDQLHKMGVKQVDFFGKEPLFDGTIFTLIQRCKELGLGYSMITNGVNIRAFIDQLEYYKPTMAMSVERLGNTYLRSSGNFVEENIKMLLERGIPVSVSVDSSNSNLYSFESTLNALYDLGVRNYYIKYISPYGNTVEALGEEIYVHPNQIFWTFDIMSKFAERGDVDITLFLGIYELKELYAYDLRKFNEYFGEAILLRQGGNKGVGLNLELYPNVFGSSISITPDGFLLGQAIEYSDDYSHRCNIIGKDLEECVKEEKRKLSLKDFIYKVSTKKCVEKSYKLFSNFIENFK